MPMKQYIRAVTSGYTWPSANSLLLGPIGQRLKPRSEDRPLQPRETSSRRPVTCAGQSSPDQRRYLTYEVLLRDLSGNATNRELIRF
jgi:hypothetical protein